MTVGIVAVVPGPTAGAIVLAELGPDPGADRSRPAARRDGGHGVLRVSPGTAAPARPRARRAGDWRRRHRRRARPRPAATRSRRSPAASTGWPADLEARVRELQESDRARRQLFADVSHELMTPLTAIRGYLETLAVPAAVPDAETRERYLRIVTEETLRLESIIGDLLDLARLEGGGDAAQPRSAVPVTALFARAAARHEAALREKSLTLDAHVAPGAEQVHGDPLRLEQAVQNLVANAVRHTPAGGRIALRRGAGRAPTRAAARRGHRPGHPARASAAGLRSLLPRRRGARPGVRRQRAGALDRPGDRRAARRPRHGVEHAGRRRALRPDAGSEPDPSRRRPFMAWGRQPPKRRPGRRRSRRSRWVPSQNGLRADWPQRHSAIGRFVDRVGAAVPVEHDDVVALDDDGTVGAQADRDGGRDRRRTPAVPGSVG